MKMTPILFSDAATDYSTQGLGALADALSCEVTEELNGEYELQMTYPVSGRRYADIKNRCIIYCKPDPYRGGQPFRTYRITRPLNGVITVYARHISYDLSGIPVNPFTAGSAAAAMAWLKSNSAVSNPFTFWTNLGTTADFSVTVPSSIRSMLGGSEGSILDTYGGEYEWDGMTVRLYSQRGQDNGVRIAYGKNLTDIEQDENIANLATGVIGYWAGTDGTLVQTSVVNAPGTYNFTRVITVDFSSDFEAQPTTEQLQQRTQQYVQDNNIGVPDVSITVSWIQLEQYSGYEGLSLLERVTLGDTVTVEFPPLGVEATARVVKTTYDALLDRYTTADIGSVLANIADTIADQQQQIANTPGKSEIQQIAEAITDTILGANGGAVRILDTNGDGMRDTLYIADNPDPAQAQKVWRFNYEGWGASENGYNGPFSVAATLEQGMYADFITAGTLLAGLIKTGTIISTSGNTEYNLDEGYIRSGPTAGTRFEIDPARINWFVENGGQSYLTGVLYSVYGATFIGANSKYCRYGWVDSGTPSSFDGLEFDHDSSNGRFTVQTLDALHNMGISGTLSVRNLNAWGDKHRIVRTPLGNLAFAAMESPEPAFCDWGGGEIGEDGVCPVRFSQQYATGICLRQAARWLVTPVGGAGSFWVERTEWGALVHGVPGSRFDWLCIAVQVDMAGQYAPESSTAPPAEQDEAAEAARAASMQAETEEQQINKIWRDAE